MTEWLGSTKMCPSDLGCRRRAVGYQARLHEPTHPTGCPGSGTVRWCDGWMDETKTRKNQKPKTTRNQRQRRLFNNCYLCWFEYFLRSARSAVELLQSQQHHKSRSSALMTISSNAVTQQPASNSSKTRIATVWWRGKMYQNVFFYFIQTLYIFIHLLKF